MRVLFAGLALPYPPMNGHRLRTWAMVRALAEDGHAVTLVSFAEPHDVAVDLHPLHTVCREVELVPAPASGSLALEPLRRLRALASPMPYGAWRFRSPEYRQALQRYLDREAFDLLLCDGVYNMQNLPRRSSVPILLNKDDVAHVILERYLTLERNPVRRLYGRLEARKVRRWEQTACRQMAAVLACSEVDRAILQDLCPEASIFVVPNVVDTDHYAPGGIPEPQTVLFQGGMDWHPNRDAVVFFVDKVLPELRRLVPTLTFRVAGRGPSDVFRRRFAGLPSVEFTGTVADMRDEIARATVCVVPLRIGSGTRLKILEAGAMAKAIVSTTLGVEGLDFVDGEEILLADDPALFARVVAGLLSDASRRRTIGTAARRRVDAEYGPPALRRALRAALGRLLDSGAVCGRAPSTAPRVVLP